MKETSQNRRLVQLAEAFTKTYKDHITDPIAIREAHCLRAMFPATCAEIGDEDLFAGRKLIEIAMDCGFGCIQQFNRVFKRLRGSTPTQWRARSLSD